MDLCAPCVPRMSSTDGSVRGAGDVGRVGVQKSSLTWASWEGVPLATASLYGVSVPYVVRGGAIWVCSSCVSSIAVRS